MKKIKIIVGILISLFFLYFALRGIKFTSVLGYLKQANYWFIIPAICFHFLAFYLRSIKWGLITRKFKDINPFGLFPLTAIGLAMNNVLPLRAGEFGRIILLSNKYGISKIQSTITLIIERLFDIIGLLIVMIVFIHLHHWPSYVTTLLNVATILIILFFLLSPVIIIGVYKTSSHTIFSTNKILRYIKDKIEEVRQGFFIYKDWKLTLTITCISIVMWVLEGLSYFIISYAFNIHISLPDFIFVCAIVNMSSALPSTSGFIGTFEFFTITLLTFLGISKSLALSYTLVLHIELLLPVTLVGIYFYFVKEYYTYMSLTQIKHLEEDG
jgi:uncharacterized protein (TIRG00374 family)